MRKLWLIVFVILVLIGASFLYIRENRKPLRITGISPLTFQEVDRLIQNSSSEAEVRECSRRLRGTKVRWSGTVTGVDQNQTVYVATNIFPTNVQFQVSREIGSTISKGQVIAFVGTVEKVSVVETFPPMPHTYVHLRDVRLGKNDSE